MVFGLYTNTDRDIGGRATERMRQYLKSCGMSYCDIPSYDDCMDGSLAGFRRGASGCDIIISFGGDGTILRAAQGLIGLDVPIVGVNLGNLGFLTEADEDSMTECVDAIIKGNFTVEKRAVIKVTDGSTSYYATNDIAVTRGLSTHTITIDILIDGKLADVVKGDGVLVATPLGSTAYSLSCGGPIISPTLPALTVTAICPHSLHSRPIVISDDSEVTILANNRDGMMRLSVDSNSYTLSEGNIRLIIAKSDLTAGFVRIKQENFYKRLISKLSAWNDLSKRE